MSITIEAGKYYRTRDGEVVGPMEFTGDPPGMDRWRAGFRGGQSFWNDNGLWADGLDERGADLVAEWADPAPDVTKALAEALENLSAVYDGIYVKMSDGESALCREAWGKADAALALYRGRQP
jgi:hypothetical protein